jgi:hypothetical protein
MADDKQSQYVIGCEMAAARAAEEQHQLQQRSPSPLAGLRYASSELDLFHLVVVSQVDAAVRSLADGFRESPGDRDDLRASLTMDDFYTVLTFTRRAAVVSLRAHSAADAHAGVVALVMVDSERVDWRDVSWAAAIAAYVVEKVDGKTTDIFSQAAGLATGRTAEILHRFGTEPPSDLGAWGYREITADGVPGLVRSDGAQYEPTADLLSMADSLRATMSGDDWNLTEATVAVRLPKVWFRKTPASPLEASLARVRACISLRGIPSPEMPNASAQMLLVFMGETLDATDAALIADAAGPSSPSSFSAFGVAVGNRFAVLIARSVVQGTPSFETAESVTRFRPALVSALASA